MNETPLERKKDPKDVHLEELFAELQQWEQEAKRLESIARESGGPAIQQDLRELQRRYQEARSALSEAEKSPAKSWVRDKEKTDEAFSALRRHASQIDAREETGRDS